MAGIAAARIRRVRRRSRSPKLATACAKLTGGQRTVPVLVEDGKVIQVGWQGRGCIGGCGVRCQGQRLLHSRARHGAGRRLPSLRVPPGARQHAAGWVLNGEEGVEIHLEGAEHGLRCFYARPEDSTAARREHRGDRGSKPREPAGLAATSPSARASAASARRCASRPICRFATIACGSSSIPPTALSVSLHQLHQLRPALHHHPGLPYDRPNTTMSDGRSTHTAPPSITIPAIAASMRSRWPARHAARTITCSRRTRRSRHGRDAIQDAAPPSSRRQHPRGQGTGRLSPGL